MNAYLVSHNGMGDNLFMVGALHFLLNFYDKIYFLCKNKYYPNVKLFFINNPNIICVPFNENNEFNEIYKIITDNYLLNDIFVCGCHKNYLQSKITNNLFLEYNIQDKNYTIEYDTLTKKSYDFIESFYKDINLNLTIFYDYFFINSTEESIELYNSIKLYDIIFIQLKSSDNISLNISNLLDKYLYDEKTILICNDKNLYNFESNSDNIINKKYISEKFVYNKIVNYIDTIKNSKEIYLIDSCFIGIILPFMKQNNLKAEKIRIIRRDLVDSIIL